MSTSQERDDDGQEWYETKDREPEWVKDMCRLPWTVHARRDGSIEIVNAADRVICKMADGAAEERGIVASVICDAVNKI